MIKLSNTLVLKQYETYYIIIEVKLSRLGYVVKEKPWSNQIIKSDNNLGEYQRFVSIDENNILILQFENVTYIGNILTRDYTTINDLRYLDHNRIGRNNYLFRFGHVYVYNLRVNHFVRFNRWNVN